MPLLDTLEGSEINREVRKSAGCGYALNCHTVATLGGGDPNRKFSSICVCVQTWKKCNKNLENKFMQSKKCKLLGNKKWPLSWKGSYNLLIYNYFCSDGKLPHACLYDFVSYRENPNLV